MEREGHGSEKATKIGKEKLPKSHRKKRPRDGKTFHHKGKNRRKASRLESKKHQQKEKYATPKEWRKRKTVGKKDTIEITITKERGCRLGLI